MNLLLVIQSYPGANDAVNRQWPFYLNAGAYEIHGIGTTDNGCIWPNGVKSVLIGDNKYIDGKHLPNRLLDTIEYCLKTNFSHFCIAEYDSIFFNKIPEWTGIAAHLAGGKTCEDESRFCGSSTSTFIHNPWFIDRPTAEILLPIGREILQRPELSFDWCGSPESSPDVFLAWVCQEANIKVKYDLMKEFSRNRLDVPGDLELAREFRINGVEIIHGLKTEHELNFITKD
jgi:hypothetical protein